MASGGKKKDGVDLSLKSRHRSRTNFSEFFVFATSGRPAFIRAANEIPYKGRWPDYTRRYSTGGAAVMFQTVETGFEVTPTIAGDLVHLKIVPRAVYGEGNAAIIRFYGAQTEMTTSCGRWVEIGGTNSRSNDVIKEILSQGNEKNRSSVSMMLMVEKPQGFKGSRFRVQGFGIQRFLSSPFGLPTSLFELRRDKTQGRQDSAAPLVASVQSNQKKMLKKRISK